MDTGQGDAGAVGMPRASDENLCGKVVDTAPIGMALVTPQGGFARVNRALCELLGRDEADLLACTWRDVTHPDDLPASVGLVRAVLAGEQESFRTRKRYLRPDGTVVWGDVSVSCTRDDVGAVTFLIAQLLDVTDKVVAHEQLVESERRFRLLAENTRDIVYQTTPDGRIVWISRSVSTSLGWDPDALVGTLALDLVDEESHALVLAERARVYAGGTTERTVVRVRAADGSRRFVSVLAYPLRENENDESITGAIVAWRDVDEIVTAQRAAQEAADRLSDAIDAVVDPFVVLDPVRADDGAIVDFVFAEANEAAGAFNGLPRDRLVGTRLLDLHPSAATNGLLDDYVRLVETGEPIRREDWAYDQDVLGGQRRWYDVHAEPFRGGLCQVWRDVTERHVTADLIADSEDRFRLLAENATDVVFRHAVDGTVEFVSDGVRRLLGREPSDVVGAPLWDLVHPDDRPRARSVAAGSLTASPHTVRLRVLTATGAPRWVEASTRVVRSRDGSSVAVVAGWRDVQAEVDALQELDRRARTDPLTGLVNRTEVLQRLRRMLSGARRPGDLIAVAFCDLDDFKAVNDVRGHLVGDRLLAVVAERIRSCVREGDTVARVGGDEILVVLDGVHDLSEAVAVAEKIRRTVSRPIDVGGQEVLSTVSVGVALAARGDDTDAIVARADRAMYQAKQSGRDRVVPLV